MQQRDVPEARICYYYRRPSGLKGAWTHAAVPCLEVGRRSISNRGQGCCVVIQKGIAFRGAVLGHQLVARRLSFSA